MGEEIIPSVAHIHEHVVYFLSDEPVRHLAYCHADVCDQNQYLYEPRKRDGADDVRLIVKVTWYMGV